MPIILEKKFLEIIRCKMFVYLCIFLFDTRSKSSGGEKNTLKNDNNSVTLILRSQEYLQMLRLETDLVLVL